MGITTTVSTIFGVKVIDKNFLHYFYKIRKDKKIKKMLKNYKKMIEDDNEEYVEEDAIANVMEDIESEFSFEDYVGNLSEINGYQIAQMNDDRFGKFNHGLFIVLKSFTIDIEDENPQKVVHPSKDDIKEFMAGVKKMYDWTSEPKFETYMAVSRG